jgi:c-di-GMP-binding flagellar brake protein YcgR
MPSATVIQSKQSTSVLEEACARNVSVEVHFEDADGAVTSARARLLGMTDELLYMDRPESGGQKASIRDGEQIKVYFLMSGKRYAFRASVAQARCSASLNATQRVTGIALSRPQEVTEEQRRADFRMSLAAYPGLTAMLHRGCAENGGSCKVDAQVFLVQLINISAGGLGTMVEAEVAGQWRSGETFFVVFELPETGQETVMLAELRHCRNVPGKRSVIAGFQFVHWEAAETKLSERHITRFIAEEQRRHLRRARS